MCRNNRKDLVEKKGIGKMTKAVFHQIFATLSENLSVMPKADTPLWK